MLNFIYFYDKLLSFYNVNTLKDLSEVTNIPISTMSSIKQRNSITALKKKCRELGIYNEIFGDLNTNINHFQNSNINKAFDLSSNSHSQDSINIGNNPICEQISKMNQTIVSSFINVYYKVILFCLLYTYLCVTIFLYVY